MKQQREKSQISCQVFFLFLIYFIWFLWWFLVFFAALDVLFFTLQIRPGRRKEKRTRTRAGWGTAGRELLMSSSRIFMALWAREWLLYWCILGQVQRCCFRFLFRTVYANRCVCARVCVCVCVFASLILSACDRKLTVGAIYQCTAHMYVSLLGNIRSVSFMCRGSHWLSPCFYLFIYLFVFVHLWHDVNYCPVQ